MGRMMMCATSTPEDEIERPECFIFRLSASPATVTDFKLEPWPTGSIDAGLTPSSLFTRPTNSSSHLTTNQSHTSASATTSSSPKSPTPSFRISKRKHHSRHCQPSMRVSRRFTDENVQRARNLAVENQEIIKQIRSSDLQDGLKRSPWEWLHHRTDEKQPNEVLMRLRRLQFEAMKRDMRDSKLKDWEISALCLEGGSRLRKVVKEEEVE